MVHFRGKSLLPARIDRFGKGSTNIARHDLRDRAQFSHRPEEICHRKPPAFPICDRFFAAKTIKIDRNINIGPTETSNEHFEMVAPIVPQDRAATLSMFHRAIVGPRMNFEPPFAFTSAVCENIVWPPALKIAAAPNRDVLDVRKLKRAIDPAAATPFRRSNVPVRMIIK